MYENKLKESIWWFDLFVHWERKTFQIQFEKESQLYNHYDRVFSWYISLKFDEKSYCKDKSFIRYQYKNLKLMFEFFCSLRKKNTSYINFEKNRVFIIFMIVFFLSVSLNISTKSNIRKTEVLYKIEIKNRFDK